MIKKSPSSESKFRLQSGEISAVFSSFLKNKYLTGSGDTSLVFYDLNFIESRINGLKSQFPHGSLHAIAVKANPLMRILKKMNGLGTGVEAASLPELKMAEKTGFLPETIVFDSPCKTKEEIEYALSKGVYVNADSFAELDRISDILRKIKSVSRIGLRINPQVGTGTIKSTSVAGEISKFGIPVNENREKIIEYYLKYSWLEGIHVHIGSQGCPVPLLVDGIRKVLDLAEEINHRLQTESKPNSIRMFDIGGGLPVSYFIDQQPVSMIEYVSLLKERCSELFNGRYRLITEFGRYIFANSGWVASKAEYVKREPGYNVIITHVGADLFIRKCYNPTDWHHHISVVDKNGKPKTGIDKTKYIVAGPLCFAGDVLATDIELPVVEEGDYILIHDTGAYTLSMWSRYNSRQMPKVIGYDGNTNFEVLKEKENPEDLEEFWS